MFSKRCTGREAGGEVSGSCLDHAPESSGNPSRDVYVELFILVKISYFLIFQNKRWEDSQVWAVDFNKCQSLQLVLQFHQVNKIIYFMNQVTDAEQLS